MFVIANQMDSVFYKNFLFIYFIQGDIIMLFAPKEKGQGLVEYALILVLVAIVVIVVLTLLGPAIGNIFSNIMIGLNPVAG